MKFLIICGSLNPVGGAGINILTYSQFLLKKGHELVFITSDHSLLKSEYGGFQGSVSYYNFEDLFNISYRHLKNLVKIKLKTRVLDEIVLAENPDVAFLHSVIHYYVVKKLTKRVPVIKFIHNHSFCCPSGTRYSKTNGQICFIRPSINCLWRGIDFGCFYMTDGTKISIESIVRRITDIYLNRIIVSKTVHAIAANSRFCKKELTQVLDGAAARKVHVVYPPIDVPSEHEITPADSTEVKKILFVGRFVFTKGVENLISALKLLSIKYEATLVGDGPDRDYLERLVSEKGMRDQVKFTGWVNYESLASFYRSHDLVVVPSRLPEPFGQVGPRAAIYGRPVVAYDVGGVSEWLLDGKTGYLAKPGDPKDLARKMELCLNNPGKLIEMGEAAREYAKSCFSTDAHYKSLLELIEVAKDNFRHNN